MNAYELEQGLIKCQSARAILMFLINAKEDADGLDEFVKALEGVYESLDIGLNIIEGLLTTPQNSAESLTSECVENNEVSNSNTKLKKFTRKTDKNFDDEMLNPKLHSVENKKIKLNDYEDILLVLSDISDTLEIIGDSVLSISDTESMEFAPLIRVMSAALKISYNQFASVGDILYDEGFDKKTCNMILLNDKLNMNKVK